ncbi:MAG TPA: Nif3-like dinuclear metal center hexameric protein [Elusimicrobiales bacterium]|nr:Nif3-like dinuclear metal center hexameric protein [Elusimicrobiales bacterium]
MPVNRDDIVNFINKYLNAGKIKDASKNGLQVEGREKIKKIVFGVSAGAKLFEKAARQNADMVIVHHGIVWDAPFTIVGHVKNRIKILLDNDINLLAYHIPLDMHSQCGNNITLLKDFPVKNIEPFGVYESETIGYKAKLKQTLTLKKICSILENRLKADCRFADFGPAKIKTIAVVTGGASSMIYQAIEQKVDLLITGESGEYVWELCRENKLSFISLGHYNSEKIGITKLAGVIKNKFKVKTCFIDIPNPF